MLVVVSVLLGCDASKEAIGSVAAEIEVSPTEMSFSSVAPYDSGTQALVIKSVGDATLEVTELALEQGVAFSVSNAMLPLRVPPGSSATVDVTYTWASDADADTLQIHSNGSASPVAVSLSGSTGVGVPEMTVDPDTFDFGEVGRVQETYYGSIFSSGSAPITIQSVEVTGEGFWVSRGGELPVTLLPGEWLPIEVHLDPYAPYEDVVYSGELVVTPDAPLEVSTFPLSGRGASEDGPVAVCSVTPTVVGANAEAVIFSGADSYDWDGTDLVDYAWRLFEAPSGSAATLGTGHVEESFVPDLAGVYGATLVVTDALGLVSDPCEVYLEAVPSQALWIEMFWSHAGDDMDLHLLAPDGELESDFSDCYYANPHPNWGEVGSEADDPSLDLDDMDGTGPENINLPAPVEGLYSVYVVDWGGQVYTPENDVTVRIYVDGVEVWSDTRPIAGEEEVVGFAMIDWPSGIVIPL